MESPILLDTISIKSGFKSLVEKTHVKEGTPEFFDLESLWDQAQGIIGPKVMYKPAYIEIAGEDQVFVDGTRLKSRVLCDNLKDSHRVFPFAATCGTELNNWAKSFKDMMHSFFLEAIRQVALTAAMQYLEAHVREHFSTGNISLMTPGALEDWPLSEQRPLFDILGDIEAVIGVQLMDSLMMNPVHSLAGIIFPTEVSFVSCQLCLREKCPDRRVPFDKKKYEEKFKKTPEKR